MKIEYAITIIVLVKYKNTYRWYISDKYYWALDLTKILYTPVELEKASATRFGITVVNSTNVESFLENMSKFKIDIDTLTLLVLEQNCLVVDESSGLHPALLVDFDRKVLKSYFPEPESFELYISDDWEGDYEIFLDEIPEAQKYWIYEGHDYFDAHKSIRKFWGEHLLTYPSDLAQTTTVSKSINSFLQEVGLPHRIGLLTEKIAGDLFLTFYATLDLTKRFSINIVNYFNFAIYNQSSQDLLYLCLQENSGKIFLVDKKNETTSFVNSSIVSFLLFLQIYLTNWALLAENMKQEQAKANVILQNIAKQFYYTDEEALEDEKDFWYILLARLGVKFAEFELESGYAD